MAQENKSKVSILTNGAVGVPKAGSHADHIRTVCDGNAGRGMAQLVRVEVLALIIIFYLYKK